ncbi:uncharacterized protein LOC124172778 isoform X2 [Ischnura elegans]|uniref:uncharacterized protein LOC124172778 isoform X2 n=1 Tax=Ischnura elegans TaxID=197161 RepID=UPI001ED8863A|nr:uncharacterized protein LOC124172778 isoform X2 [Ischnura elegans]
MLFFPLTIGNKSQQDQDNEMLKEALRDAVGTEAKMCVYSSKMQSVRKVIVRPGEGWGEQGLLGISIRFCSFEGANENVWHVLDTLTGLIKTTMSNIKRRKKLCEMSYRHCRRVIANEVREIMSGSVVADITESKMVSDAHIDSDSSSNSDKSSTVVENLQDADLNFLETSSPIATSSLNSDSSDNDNLAPVSFATQLAQWALNEGITHSSLSSLLKLLKQHNCFSDLPSDSRTLLCTPRITAIKEVAPGSYCHFGLSHGVMSFISSNPKLKFKDNITVSVNIDGVPLTNSSGSCLWPILGCVDPYNAIFVIGAYHGFEKPHDVNCYLEDFVKEAVDLTSNGIQHNGHYLQFSIEKIICDSPAKAFILKVKSHSGYSSCSKCTVEGEYRERRVCFPGPRAPKRSDLAFVNHVDDSYHLGTSALERIPNLGLVTNVPLDYMHLVCLGVMRKMIYQWLSGKLSVRLQHKYTVKISTSLEENIKPFVPKEFARKARSLKFVQQWKATEFRQFLLYSGPVALKSVLNYDLYLNFLTLHVAIRILCCKSLLKYRGYAGELLEYFVLSFGQLYGQHNVSHNVHCLLHLVDDVEKFGQLDNFSAFKFESYLHILKRSLRKSERPLQQLSRRYQEMEKLNHVRGLMAKRADIVFGFEHNDGPLPQGCTNPQYHRMECQGYTVMASKLGDNCCQTVGGSIVLVKNFVFSQVHGCQVMIGQEFLVKQDFFVSPCKSSLLGIHICKELSESKMWPISNIEMKCAIFPLSRADFVVFPLLHLQGE